MSCDHYYGWKSYDTYLIDIIIYDKTENKFDCKIYSRIEHNGEIRSEKTNYTTFYKQ